jgi:hypothetical protein
MSFPIVFTKQLGAASSNGIATSQSVTGGANMVLNGSLTNYLSTTSTAAVLPGAVVIPLTSITGITVGESVVDSTTATLANNTTVVAIGTASVTIWPPVGGTVGIGSGDTIVFGGAVGGTATIDAVTAANSAVGRRVVVAYSGTDTSFVVVGTNGGGNIIKDTIVGASGAGQSNMDFVTVTSITPVGSITAATAGTNGVGSSPWSTLNAATTPFNFGVAVELVSGSVNFTLQYTYDDPNYLQAGVAYPLPFNDANINGASATTSTSNLTEVAAARIFINSGTGEIRVRLNQAGIG